MARIRRLTQQHIPVYASLIRSTIRNIPYYAVQARKQFAQQYTTPKLKKLFGDKTNIFWAVWDRQRLIGFCCGHLDFGMFWLDWIGIHPAYRKQQIASRCMQTVETFASNHRLHKIWFDSRTNNTESIGLFQKLGYRKNTTIIDHWCREDFYIWEKWL